ncbi:hypothetical protein KL86DYS1_31267 [uncultured Dysgonomonas sp.]|uniref:Uncharacterized protein n=1 Tax=uncultured Dysgonomonas sp. TaxID=206096 RepID=A0A212K2X4_9BACT|nr:hypothetical protein KL86DYS1_31267 [uncultured Dysgonomonas sp.]
MVYTKYDTLFTNHKKKTTINIQHCINKTFYDILIQAKVFKSGQDHIFPKAIY